MKKITILAGLLALISWYNLLQGMNNDVDGTPAELACIKEEIGYRQQLATNQNRKHAQALAEIEMNGKKEGALFYGIFGFFSSTITYGLFLEEAKKGSLLYFCKIPALIFFGTLSTALLGKTLHNTFSTIQENQNGEYKVVGLYTRIKNRLF